MIKNMDITLPDQSSILEKAFRGLIHLAISGLTLYFALVSYVDGYHFYSLYWLTMSGIALGTISMSQSLLSKVIPVVLAISFIIWAVSWIVLLSQEMSFLLSLFLVLIAIHFLSNSIPEGIKLCKELVFLTKKMFNSKFTKNKPGMIFAAISVFLFCAIVPQYLGYAKAENTIKALNCIGDNGQVISCYNYYPSLEISHVQDNTNTITLKGNLNFETECKGFAKKYATEKLPNSVIGIKIADQPIEILNNKISQSSMEKACEANQPLAYTMLLKSTLK